MDPECKSVKGSDREQIKKLQTQLDDAVWVAMVAFISQCMVPYMSRAASKIESKEVPDEKLFDLQEGLCLLSLPESGHAYTKLLSSVKEAGEKLHAQVEEFGKALAGNLPVAETQLLIENFGSWGQEFKQLCEGAFPNCEFMENDLDTILGIMTKAVNSVLGGQVNSEATSCVLACCKFVRDVLFSEGDRRVLEKDLVSSFKQDIVKSYRMSSVMGEEGACIRRGLNSLEIMVESNQILSHEKIAGEGTEELGPEFDLNVIGKLNQLLDPAVSTPTPSTTATPSTDAGGNGDAPDGRDGEEKAPAKVKAGDMLSLVPDLMAMFADSSAFEGFDVKLFTEQAGTFVDWLKKSAKRLNDAVMASMEERIQELVVPDVVTIPIPEELCAASSLEVLVEKTDLVKKTFRSSSNKEVLKSTCAIESLLLDIKKAAGELKLPLTFFCPNPDPKSRNSIEGLESLWCQSLSWMWGSQL